MMRAFSILALVALLTPAMARPGDPPKTDPPKTPAAPSVAERSVTTQVGMRKVDLLLQLMPLVLKKKQISQLMSQLETVRKNQDKIFELENEKILTLEKEIADAVDAAEKKGSYPPRELRNKIFSVTKRLAQARMIARESMVASLDEKLPSILDKGQMKILASSYKDVEVMAADPAAVTDEMKRKAFIRDILLDPLTYDLLGMLFKNAAE